LELWEESEPARGSPMWGVLGNKPENKSKKSTPTRVHKGKQRKDQVRK